MPGSPEIETAIVKCLEEFRRRALESGNINENKQSIVVGEVQEVSAQVRLGTY